jgi:DNA-binding NarL/FixJ family response regulator
MVERVIGYEKTKPLVEVGPDVKRRIPLATRSLARCLHVQGLSFAEIARRLRLSDSTVRGYLKGQNMPGGAE